MSLQKYHNSNENYSDAIAKLILSRPEERDAAKRELLRRGRELSRAAQGLTRDEVKGLDTASGKHFEGKRL